MKENFAIKLRELRKASGMTQEQLAAEFGVSVQAVSKWETAASYPDIELMPRIADLFGCAMLRTRKTLMRVKKFRLMPNSNAMLPATRNRLKSNTRTKTTMKMTGTMKKTMTMKMTMTMKKMMTAAASL